MTRVDILFELRQAEFTNRILGDWGVGGIEGGHLRATDVTCINRHAALVGCGDKGTIKVPIPALSVPLDIVR